MISRSPVWSLLIALGFLAASCSSQVQESRAKRNDVAVNDEDDVKPIKKEKTTGIPLAELDSENLDSIKCGYKVLDGSKYGIHCFPQIKSSADENAKVAATSLAADTTIWWNFTNTNIEVSREKNSNGNQLEFNFSISFDDEKMKSVETIDLQVLVKTKGKKDKILVVKIKNNEAATSKPTTQPTGTSGGSKPASSEDGAGLRFTVLSLTSL